MATPYIIKPNDTLSNLAQANNTTVANLQSLNPSITDPNKIYAGSTLNLGEPISADKVMNNNAIYLYILNGIPVFNRVSNLGLISKTWFCYSILRNLYISLTTRRGCNRSTNSDEFLTCLLWVQV